MGIGIMFDLWCKIGLKGKFCLFVFYVVFLVMLLVIVNFVGILFEVMGKIVVVMMLFMLYGLVFSMMNCLYGVMVFVIIKNLDECVLFVVWCQGGVIFGLLLCIVGFVLVMNLIEGNVQFSYIFVVMLFLLFGLLFMWLCYVGVKECYVEVKFVDNV